MPSYTETQIVSTQASSTIQQLRANIRGNAQRVELADLPG